MTRFECIQRLSKEDMAEWLCDLMLEAGNDDQCEICPARYMCYPGRLGWVGYLEKDPGTGKGIWSDLDSCIKRFFKYSDETISKLKGKS